MQPDIRRSGPGDFDRIFELLRQLTTMAEMNEEDRRRLRANFIRLLSDPDFFSLVAWDGERVLGVINVSRRRLPAGNLAWIDELAVAPEARGCGLGRTLCSSARELSRSAWSIVHMGVATAAANLGAQRFYPRAGFLARGLLFDVAAGQTPVPEEVALRPAGMNDNLSGMAIPGLDEAGLRRYLSEPGSLLLVAESQGVVIGAAAMSCSRVLHGSSAWFDHVVVAPEHRGMGMGRALVRAGVLTARQTWRAESVSASSWSVSGADVEFARRLECRQVGVTYEFPL